MLFQEQGRISRKVMLSALYLTSDRSYIKWEYV
jgi:hypothetical protein